MLKKKIKQASKAVVLRVGPSAVRFVPNANRRDRLMSEIYADRASLQRVDFTLRNLNSKLPVGFLLSSAKKAQITGRNDDQLKILERAYQQYPTHSIAVLELAKYHLAQKEIDKATRLLKKAIILRPTNNGASLLYLQILQDSKDCSGFSSFLSNWKSIDMKSVWSICKDCRDSFELNAILDRLTDGAGNLPEQYVRPVANAATRVERFDLAREKLLESIEATEVGETSTSKVKTIGNEGTTALIDVVTVLREAGIPHFAAAGTCLGIVRSGKPLPHDQDVDIGIMDEDWDRGKLRTLFQDHPLFDFDNPHPKSPKLGLVHKAGVTIDLFRFYEEDGDFWHDGVFVRWKNKKFELESRLVKGVEVSIPQGTEYLSENYGDWETPDPLFDAFINGPNRQVTWPEYYHVNLLRTILVTLRQGKNEKCRSLIKIGIAEDIFDAREAISLSRKYPLLCSNVEEVLTFSRSLYADGKLELARAVIFSAISTKRGNFKLWSELSSMMKTDEDFDLLYQLWRSVPARVANTYGPCRAMARAACITGHEDEGRMLLRRLIERNYLTTISRQKLNARKLLRSGLIRIKPLIKKLQIERIENLEKEDNFAENAKIALRDLYIAFENLPQPFLVSGTLLGHVREGGFIGWDKDIDVGIFSSNEDGAKIEESLISVDNFFVRKVDLTAARIRLVHTNGTMIDVFPHYPDKDNRIWHDGSATRWWNTPFKLTPAVFVDQNVMIPDDPELYLDENYGDWRKPDAFFDARIDAPNVETTDPGYLLSLHYFSLLDSIRKGNSAKRNRYAKMLAEMENDDWFLRFVG